MSLARCGGGDDRDGNRFGGVVGELHRPRGRRARRTGRRAVHAQRKRARVVLPAPVRERDRGVERVAGRDEARRVRLHHELWRDLRLHGTGAGGARIVGNGRHAHLADEFGQLEIHVRLPVLQRHVQLPGAERLEPPVRHGADAVEQIVVRAAAHLHAGALEAVVDDGEEVVVEVIERMVGVTRRAKPGDGIRHLLVREDVDALVHHRHGGVCAAYAVGSLRGNVRHEFAAARVAARHVRRHLHLQRAVARGDLDRHHAPGAIRGMLLSGRGGLHHAQRHVHARSQFRLDRLQRDLRCRVRERDDAGIGDFAVHHLEPGIPLERGLHGDARHVAGIIDRFVRDERHVRRRGERGPHGRVVARAPHPVGCAERNIGGGVAQRHGEVAAGRPGHFERGRALRRHAHLHGRAHRIANLVAHPLEETVVVALEPVDVLDALKAGLEFPRAEVRRAVGIDERHVAGLRLPVLAQHVR